MTLLQFASDNPWLTFFLTIALLDGVRRIVLAARPRPH